MSIKKAVNSSVVGTGYPQINNCVKSVRIRNFSSPYFQTFRLNT